MEPYMARFEGNNLLTPESKGDIIRPLKNMSKIAQAPLRWGKPTVVAVCFMGDLFHDRVPYGIRTKMFDVMVQTPQHTYLILTKRPRRMNTFIDGYLERRKIALPPNMWIGISAENQVTFENRLVGLVRARVPSTNKFLSLEPLLGPIDISMAVDHISQVLVGAETGPKKKIRYCNPEWVSDIVKRCNFIGLPIFVKQLHIGIDKNGYPAISKNKQEHNLIDLDIRKLAWG
jgi:protein gp37